MTTTIFPGDHVALDTHHRNVSGEPILAERGQVATDTQTSAAPLSKPSLFDPGLSMLASLLDDVEGARKSQDNRIRILTTHEPDEDGVYRGFGLDEDDPAVTTLQILAEGLDFVEAAVIKDLEKTLKKHPLGKYQKQAKGVGAKQLARLLGAIGDPYVNETAGTPRTVSQLWAYCGLHTLPAGAMPLMTPIKDAPQQVAAKRQKGVKANWSTDAKTRAYLIATSCIKQTGSEYRKVYDVRRAHTAVTHPDWTLGHSHNDALRIVSKRVLRDLWRAARDYHTEP